MSVLATLWWCGWVVDLVAALCFPNGTVYVYDGTTIESGQQLEVLACGSPTTFCEQEATVTLLEQNANLTEEAVFGTLTLAEYATNYEQSAAGGEGGQERPLVYSTVVGGNWTVAAAATTLQTAGRVGVEAPTRTYIGVDAAKPYHTMLRTIPSVYGTPLTLRLTTATVMEDAPQAMDDPHECVLRACRDTRCREYQDYDLAVYVNRGISGLPHDTAPFYDDVVAGVDMVLHYYTGAPMIFFEVRYCVPGAASARVDTQVELYRLLCESPVTCATPDLALLATFIAGTSVMDATGTKCDVLGRNVRGMHTLRVTNTPGAPELPAAVLVSVNAVTAATIDAPLAGRQVYVFGCDQGDCSTATGKSGINGVTTTAFDENAIGFSRSDSALAVATDHAAGVTYVGVWGDVDGRSSMFDTDVFVCDLTAGGSTVGTCAGPYALVTSSVVVSVSKGGPLPGTGGRIAAMTLGASGRLHYVACPQGHVAAFGPLYYATQADANVNAVTSFTSLAVVDGGDDFTQADTWCAGHVVVLELGDGTVWMAFHGQDVALGNQRHVVVATCLQSGECRSTPLGGTAAYGRRIEHPDPAFLDVRPVALDAYVGPRGLPVLVVYSGRLFDDPYTEQMSVYECQNTHCEAYRGTTSGAAGP